MNRYIGSKTKILTDIANAISELGEIKSVCDIFAGSLAVSLHLKRLGHTVITNDVNPLSYAYARAFVIPNEIPQLDVKTLFKNLDHSELHELEIQVEETFEAERNKFESNNKWREFDSWVDFKERHYSLVMVIAFLQNSIHRSHPRVQLRKDIFDNYTKRGRYSSFTSLRGTRGKRNFFSANNAKRLDFILSHIRFWVQSNMISEEAKYTLLSVLLDSMERFVNIQGTYHDFPRNTLEQRARKKFRMVFPNYFGLLRWNKKHVASCEDSMAFISRAPKHDVLYIDPPYNFRQYTTYYHLPNLFVQYPEIVDLDDYMSKLEFVRGQNMHDDFSSQFSNREQFLPALTRLVEKAKCRFVLLSYFDGVNHWNDFLAEDNTTGFKKIKAFFRSSLFVPNRLKIIPIDRLNYQSQNGHRAKRVTEYLFVAERSKLKSIY